MMNLLSKYKNYFFIDQKDSEEANRTEIFHYKNSIQFLIFV